MLPLLGPPWIRPPQKPGRVPAPEAPGKVRPEDTRPGFEAQKMEAKSDKRLVLLLENRRKLGFGVEKGMEIREKG